MTDEGGISRDSRQEPAAPAPDADESPVATSRPTTRSEPALPDRILLHLLRHHGELVRFEASPWTTEGGIVRGLPGDDPAEVMRALRTLEQSGRLTRRSQYVVGAPDPRVVFVLTLAGHRRAREFPADLRDGSD